jgi:hypothetical protein
MLLTEIFICGFYKKDSVYMLLTVKSDTP